MKEISDAQYDELVRDASDNYTIYKISKLIFIIILFLLLYFIIGNRFVDAFFRQYNEQLQCDINTMKAKNDVLIREIQSEGMTTDEYLKWYEIYKNTD